ncbi:hypothetical protein CHS0354_008744 [Potamilus streckersoni]|uniref:Mab-21-like nucleotidyltransferase domain-containing protein n=1 Tax=Potamilus streckersoni TaxID=2493646 RepID=A0AAE0T616_9BIVA|nr:hypothetical protein CHS0354_008744 [Potamilus streckersoni]
MEAAWLVVVFIIVAIVFGIYLWWQFYPQNVGINLNKWQYPVKEFSKTDDDLQKRLKLLECGGDLDISEKDWNTTISVVNEILETLLQAMRSEAQEYEGLILNGYRKQGSAREGLKVRAPDEFDVLLEYRIEGLSVEAKPLIDFGISYPGLGKMKILTPRDKVNKHFKTWLGKGVIVMHNSSYYLNARILHQSIFESIIDKCREKITNITEQNLPFQLTRSMHPPSINIRIERKVVNSGRWRRFINWILRKANIPEVIDIDIVPAMIIGMEKAKGSRKFMDCPRYAVVKWKDERQQSASCFDAPAMIWRFCTSGYEKHYMDLARKHKGKRYIMTACRIIKMLINKEKEKRRRGYQPLPISLFLRSYDLKNISFYCMMYTESVKGVHEALGYFLGFLKISLKEENLPQFFTGNKNLKEEFPACAEGGQINLFRDVPQGTFIQARSSFDTILTQLFGMYDTEAFKSVTRWKFWKFVKPIQNQACSIV